MTNTLAELIDRVQAQLIDDGTRFSDATVTAAIREALKVLNMSAPWQLNALVTPVADTLEYEVTDEDAGAWQVTGVYLQGDEDYDTALDYSPFWLDERLFVRLKYQVSTSETIIIYYTRPHTINGLDSETDSTLTDFADQVLVDGACWNAIMFRAASRIETINLNQGVSDNYIEAANHFRTAFFSGLDLLSKKQTPPSVELFTDTKWNDKWHNWPQ